MVLSGNFGEPRTNHFHSGLDLKTNNVVGLDVKASADGHVSRIKISPYGYGKAIYVSHKGGYTTVYAHLNGFASQIAAYIKEQQYQKKSFAVELYPPAVKFKVAKGEVIAYSGNSGSSTAPHLHFEIREGDVPVNPFNFGMTVNDTKDPVIESVYIYGMNENGPTRYKKYKVRKKGHKYKLANDTIYAFTPNIGLGVEVYDLFNGADNHNGVYSITLFVDNKPIFQSKVDKIPFHKTRYLNAHIDYNQKIMNREIVQKCFVVPNNELPIYKKLKDKGMIKLERYKTHTVDLVVSDYIGNVALLSFYVKLENVVPTKRGDNSKWTQAFSYELSNTFKNANIKVQFPAKCFYDSLFFKYSTTENKSKANYSPIHHVHHAADPVHKSFNISIKPDAIPERIKSKSLICHINHNGRISSKGGSWSGDFISTISKVFGDFYVTVDTMPPRIKNIDLHSGMRGRRSFKFKITDNLAGIKSYSATVDGKWILMEYEPKSNSLVHHFDSRIGSGHHSFELVVVDGRKNKSNYTYKFNR